MGQQQILFLILGVCILGIAISVGVISVQEEPATENREYVIAQLRQLGKEAQAYYARSAGANEGAGTFLELTLLSKGIDALTATPSTPRGEFAIRQTGTCNSLQIVGIGVVPGDDTHLPVRAMITVWPDSTALTVLN
jgi:hypothetical protein